MIDNPLQAERLLAKLTRALPLTARPKPELAATLRHTAPGFAGQRPCRIPGVTDAGDVGGIVCRLDLDGAGDREAVEGAGDRAPAPSARRDHPRSDRL